MGIEVLLALLIGAGLGLLAAIAATCVIWASWMAVRRWGPAHLRGAVHGFPIAPIAVLALMIGLPVGCWAVNVPAPQPRSLETVAAVEVPLRTPADHADLLAILRRIGSEQGLHVDDGTASWREFRRDAPPDEDPFLRSVNTKTIYVGVYRGKTDNDMEADVDDGGHQGRAWLTFLSGEHPDLATKARARLVAEINRRWPDARVVPVMPNGSLPRAEDLLWTGTSYVVMPGRLAAYAPEEHR